MRYRSEVGLIITNTAFNNIKTIINNDDSKYELFNTAELYQNDIYTILHWCDIKYDKELEEVKFIEDVRKANDSYFVRIGEEYNDIEESWNGGDYDMLDYLSIDRSVYIGI